MSRINLLSLFLPVILLGAGCASVTKPQPEPVVVQEKTVPDVIQTEVTSYVMSSGIVMLTAPSGWAVRQLDAGGASVIEVEGADPASQWMFVIIASTKDWDTDEPVSYQAWLEQDELASPKGSREIDGVAMDTFELMDQSGTTELSYTGILEPDRPLYVRVRVPSQSSQAQQLLDSIIFFPTDEERASAQVIR